MVEMQQRGAEGSRVASRRRAVEWLGSEWIPWDVEQWAMGSGAAEDLTQVHLLVHATEVAMGVGCVRASLAWHATPDFCAAHLHLQLDAAMYAAWVHASLAWQSTPEPVRCIHMCTLVCCHGCDVWTCTSGIPPLEPVAVLCMWSFMWF